MFKVKMILLGVVGWLSYGVCPFYLIWVYAPFGNYNPMIAILWAIFSGLATLTVVILKIVEGLLLGRSLAKFESWLSATPKKEEVE